MSYRERTRRKRLNRERQANADQKLQDAIAKALTGPVEIVPLGPTGGPLATAYQQSLSRQVAQSSLKPTR